MDKLEHVEKYYLRLQNPLSNYQSSLEWRQKSHEINIRSDGSQANIG